MNAVENGFQFESMVHSRKAVFTHQIETDSYQQKSVEVEIANDFSLDCAFQLSMTQEVLVNNRWEDACQYIRGGANKRAKVARGKVRKKEVQVVKESDYARAMLLVNLLQSQ